MRGVTIAEMVMAMFLLLLLILGVVSLFTALLGSSGKSSNQAVGVMFAEKVLEDISHRGRKTYPAFDPALSGSAAFYTGDPSNPTQFTYSVTAVDLDPARNADPDARGENWLLETEVRWWSDTATTRSGQGKLFVRQARLVYVSR